MSSYNKMIKKIVAWLLLVMLFMGAISLQIVAEAAISVHNEQKAWQSILDANLQPEKPEYEDGAEPDVLQENDNNLDYHETNNSIKTEYTEALFKETDTYMTDRFIVKYKSSSLTPSLSKHSIQTALKNAEVKTLDRRTTNIGGQYDVISLEIPIELSEFKKAIGTMQLDKDIEYIQPDHLMELSAINESQFNNIGIDTNKSGSRDRSDEGLLVAIFDTGIDNTHPDLVGNIYTNPSETASNGIDDDGNGYIDDVQGWDFFNNDNSVNDSATYTDQWHGTHIAGIIEEQAPGAVILPIKIFEGGFAYTSSILNAISFAESLGVKVINCSWGSRFENMALREAIESSSCLFVCAAGNNLYNLDNNPVFPAAFSTELDNVISVASVNELFKLSRISNYGANTVDIAAPGENIESTWLDGGYRSISGTSMSAGFVSGAAALIFARNNTYSALDVKKRLISSADTVTGLEDKIINGKLLNAEYATGSTASPNTNVIDVPDDDPLPTVIPNEPQEDENYELYGAENYVTYKESMSTARHGLQVIELGGKIYAIGGQTTDTGGFTNVVERYDPVTDAWEAVANMNVSRSYFGAVVYGGKIYAIGGANSGSGNLTSIESYDPGANKWTVLAVTLPVALRNFSATLIPGTDSVYILGGYTTSADSPRNTVYEYKIAASNGGTVTARPNLSGAVSNHIAFYRNGILYTKGGNTTNLGYGYRYVTENNTPGYEVNSCYYLLDGAVAKFKDRVLCVGGTDGVIYHANITNHFFVEDVNASTCVGHSNHILCARSGSGAIALNGKVYIVGGRNASVMLKTVEMLDLGWEEKAAPPVPISDYKTVSLNGKMYVMGGQIRVNNIWQRSNAVYEYNSMSNVWKAMAATMPIYVTDFSLVAAYGKIYLFGGYASATATGAFSSSNKIYEYDPQTDVWTQKNTMSVARYYLATTLYNGKIFISGGETQNAQDTVETYDPLTNVIETDSTITNSNYDYGRFSCVLNNELYVFLAYSTNYYKYNSVSKTWTAYTAGGCSPAGMFIVINGSLYSCGNYGDYIYPEFYMFSAKDNTWGHYSVFNYYGYLTGVTEISNKTYLLTGSTCDIADSLVTYTPPATAWMNIGYLPDNRVGLRAVSLNNEVYTAGGLSYDNGTTLYFKTLFKYQKSNDTWATMQNMNYARSHLGLVAENGKIYAIGGNSNGSACTYVEEYNPNTNSWAIKSAIPATMDMAAASYDGKVYIFGGRTSPSGSGIKTVRVYNISTNSWSTSLDMPTARFGAGAAVIDGKIYVVGGFTSGTNATNAVEIYDTKSNTWDSTKTQLSVALGWEGVVASDSLYVIGGYNGTNFNSLVYEYSPVTNEWYTWAGPNMPRYDFGTAITENGIYVAAGYMGGVTSDCEFLLLNSLRNDFRHLGDDTVNLTGNFSRTYTDSSYTSQGFNIEFTRTYNSHDTRANLISPGWTFGFQGKAESSGNDVVIRLPNGSGCTFKKNPGGSFTAFDSRSTLIKNQDNTYTLTTKDRYSYGFNTNGDMCWMKDRNGNTITIGFNQSGQVSTITDQVGRTSTVAYQNGRIKTITDPAQRVVTYNYDSADRLSSVQDPNGNYTYYTYFTAGNTTGLLNTVKNNSNTVIESITYLPKQGDKPIRVAAITDYLGNATTYTYNDNDGKLTAKDSNNRINITWYDKFIYPICTQDAEGKQTLTSYNLSDGLNRYGEIKSHTDRNGNSTWYERDTQGNIKRQINPDGSTRDYTYDSNNNLLSEKDELGKYTFYVYDTNGINLVKTAQPLNGTDIYSSGAVQTNFAITSYDYYTGAQALSQTGKTIYGLLKTVTGPEGGITTYTYDSNGYIATVSNPLSKVTTYQYNKLGWLKSVTSPKGYTTSDYYDKNGNLLRTGNPDGGKQRLVYDFRNNVIQKVMPAQYLASADTAATFSTENIQNSASTAYTQTSDGYRYTYAANGTLTNVKDPLNNTTAYTYDIYGNKQTETKPNGAVYGYTYTVMNLLDTATFKETSSSAAVTLIKYDYAILQSGKTTMTTTQYFDNSSTAVTKTTFDYAGRAVRTDQPDGTYITSAYNTNGTLANTTDAKGNTTYFAYDGLNRQIRQWSPAGTNTYEYSATTYDKDGQVTQKVAAKTTVANSIIPTTGLVTTTFTYNAGGQLTQDLTSGGAKTTYAYDNDGNLTDKYMYYDSSNSNREYYTYNNMDQLQTTNLVTQYRDIYGYSDTTTNITLTTTKTYDKNGNILTVTDPNNIATTYTYDLLNRRLTTSQPGVNENNAAVTITTSATYNWAGDILTATDELGNITTNTFDQRGFLSKTTDAKSGVSYFTYDRAGRLTAEVSPKNYSSAQTILNMPRTEYSYDQMGRTLKETQVYKDATGTWKHVVSKANTYDNNGNIIKQQDALGYQLNYGTILGYDKQNRVTSITDPESNVSTTAYDGLGRVSSKTNGRNVATAYTYNDNNQILTVTTGGVLLQTNAYDLLGNVLTSKDGNNNTTTNTYNSLNKPRTKSLPGDTSISVNTVTYKYTKLGKPASQTDSLGKQSLSTYDNQGRILTAKEQTSAGAQTITVSSAYDKAGNLRYQTDGNGNITQYTYDQLNRKATAVVTVKDINNATTVSTTTFGYDANSNLTSETDWRGNTYTYTYDDLNRLTQKADPTGIVTEKLTYNDNNAQTHSIDALNNTTQYQYDKNGSLTKTINGAGDQQTQYYDGVGNVERTVDGNNNSTYYTFDSLNRLTQVKNALNETTKYTYDNSGNMLTQIDGSGNVTTVQYNARNLPIKRIEPGGLSGQTVDATKTMSYTYKADGSVATVTDQNGAVTSYTYDVHGRALTNVAGSLSISYTYDNNGNVLTQVDANGTTTRTYDALNRTTSKNVPGIGLTKYLYDVTASMPTGHLGQTTIDPKGNTVTKIYDRAGRLYQVKSGADTTTYAYYANGNRQSQTYPNGVTTQYTYYADNRLNTLANKLGNTYLSTFNYGYDGTGNMLSKLDLKGTTSYVYDALGRLKKVTEPGGKVTQYTFDAAGNRLKETVTVNNSDTITTYTYNNQSRLIKTVETSGNGEKTTDFYYDNNGSQISKLISVISGAAGDEAFAFTQPGTGTGTEDEITFEQNAYDVFGRLVSVQNDNYIAEYNYNADGLRISKNITKEGITKSTKFMYESGYITLELDGTGAQTAYNVYGNDSILSRKTAQGTSYYLYNGRGDVVQLTNAWGAVTASYDYDAFGNLLEAFIEDTNPFRYSGEYFDLCSKRYYLRSRYYDPSTGRFTQRDKFLGYRNDPLSLNRYTYCHNNPIKYCDPTGYIVSDTDKANLTKVQQDAIQKETNKYLSAPAGPAGDKQRAEANAAANAIRTSAGYSGGNNGTSISVSSGQNVKTVVVNKITTVNNSGTISTVSVLAGATSIINNSGTIGTVDNKGTATISNTGSIVTVNNSGTVNSINNSGTITTINVINNGSIGKVSNSGTIATINIANSGSVGTISNTNVINSIVTGQNSSVAISNAGSINTIDIGEGSSSTITNAGFINSIVTGSGSAISADNAGLITNIIVGNNGVLDGKNAGYVGSVVIGTGGTATNQWKITSAATILMMNNEYILNSLLTAADRTPGVGVSRIGGTLYKDFSNPVNTALSNAESNFAAHAGWQNYRWFIDQVNHGKAWDIKNNDPWDRTIADKTYPGELTPIVVNSQIVTPNMLGNMTYGYLGTASGYTLNALLAGGDYANGSANGGGALGGVFGAIIHSDSMEDQMAVRAGVEWYQNTHK